MSENFASGTVLRHLLRGTIGFAALVGAVAGVPVFGWYTLLLAPVGLVMLRGCPMCWLIGLMQTVSATRVRRDCRHGRCELTVAPHTKTD